MNHRTRTIAPWLLYLATGGAAVLFMSALIDRGFAAALVAILFIGSLSIGLTGLGALSSSLKAVVPAKPLFAPGVALAGLGFLAGSLLAFTRGRVHLGSRLRRVALAFGTFLIVFGAPVSYATIRVAQASALSPRDTDMVVYVLGVSPNRSTAIVSGCRIARAYSGPFGVMLPPKTAVWAVPLSGGPIVKLADRYCLPRRFSSDGLTVDLASVDGGKIRDVQTVDLVTGRILSTRPAPPHRRSHHLLGDRPSFRRANEMVITRSPWAEILRTFTGSRQLTLVTLADGVRHPLPATSSWAYFWISKEERDVILSEGAWGTRQGPRGPISTYALVPISWRRKEIGAPLLDTESFTQIPGEGNRYVLFSESDRVFKLDTRNLELTPVPALDGARIKGIIWAAPGLRFLVPRNGHYLAGELTGKGKIRADGPAFPGLRSRPFWFDGETVLCPRKDGTGLDLMKRDGTLRTLLPSR